MRYRCCVCAWVRACTCACVRACVRVCVCVCIPPIAARQRLGKYPPVVTRQRLGSVKIPLSLLGNSSVEIMRSPCCLCLSVCPYNCFVFYAVRVIKESRLQIFEQCAGITLLPLATGVKHEPAFNHARTARMPGILSIIAIMYTYKGTKWRQ
jgi:hypothetical protein